MIDEERFQNGVTESKRGSKALFIAHNYFPILASQIILTFLKLIVKNYRMDLLYIRSKLGRTCKNIKTGF